MSNELPSFPVLLDSLDSTFDEDSTVELLDSLVELESAFFSDALEEFVLELVLTESADVPPEPPC